MFQIGDIVWDITPEYKVLYFTGIIVNTGVVLGYPVFHVRFFHSFEEIISLQPHEIQKIF